MTLPKLFNPLILKKKKRIMFDTMVEAPFEVTRQFVSIIIGISIHAIGIKFFIGIITGIMYFILLNRMCCFYC